MAAALRRDQALRGAQVGQRRGASLADQIETEDIGAQPEALAHIAREPGTQVAGAGADEHRVDVARLQVRIAQCRARRRRGELGRVAREPRVQRVGVGLERFFERLQREVPRPDAVALAQEDMLQRGLRARFQDGELRRALQCFPAFLLGVSPGRDGLRKT